MRNLFRPPSPELARDTALALAAIEAALPMSAAHRKTLPFAVRDLSRLLTTERAGLGQPYWSSARLQAAYCRYFLPWNLQRLSWLLPGLRLSLSPGDTVLDLGSGPLTLPLALWIAYPEWRELPLSFVCADVAPHPLDLGKAIFRRLAGEGSPWRLELVRAPLESALRGFRGKAALITAGNVLNEIPAPKNAPLESRLEEFAHLAASRLAPQGRLLAVEPGNRLGGKLVALLRRAAFSVPLAPEGPCPHWGPCPMQAPGNTGWCHFSHPTHGAPKPLLELTERAKLVKKDLSLSCLLLRFPTPEEQALLPVMDPDLDEDADEATDLRYPPPPLSKTGWVRILSDPIRLPDRKEPARYACTEKGLALVHDALRLPSGAALSVRWPEQETRDPKSGALNVELGGDQARPGTERGATAGGDNRPARTPRPESPRPYEERKKPRRPDSGERAAKETDGRPRRPSGPKRPDGRPGGRPAGRSADRPRDDAEKRPAPPSAKRDTRGGGKRGGDKS